MERVSTNYDRIDDMEYITSDDLSVIELNAALLDLDECFDMIFIDKKHLTEAESRYCAMAHRRGKKNAIAKASNHLFARMQERNGTAACIEFLQNCGKFSIEGSGTSTASGASGSGFAFNVYMPGDEPGKPKLAEAS